MLIKVGDWKQGLLRFKRSGGWVNPKSLFVKANGVWRFIGGEQLLQLQMSDLVPNTAYWAFDPTVGWYVNSYSWGAKYSTILSADVLSKIRKVSAVFTGYYDYPTGSLGESGIVITMSNGAAISIGTYDGHTYGYVGQTINAGDAGAVNGSTRNVIQERFTYTIPEGVTVTAIQLMSSGYNGDGNNYPFSLRGMKDFEFTLRH